MTASPPFTLNTLAASLVPTATIYGWHKLWFASEAQRRFAYASYLSPSRRKIPYKFECMEWSYRKSPKTHQFRSILWVDMLLKDSAKDWFKLHREYKSICACCGYALRPQRRMSERERCVCVCVCRLMPFVGNISLDLQRLYDPINKWNMWCGSSMNSECQIHTRLALVLEQ